MYADLEALMDCDDCKNCLVWTWYVEHSRYGYSKWTYKVIVKLRTKKSGNQCCGHFSECH